MLDPVDVYIGKVIRQQRLLKKKSQSDLAREMGISFQQVQKYETGVNRISASRLFTVSKLLRIPVTSFFHEITDDIAVKASEKISKHTIPENEIFELVRVYQGIHDVAVRRHVLGLMKSVSESGGSRKG